MIIGNGDMASVLPERSDLLFFVSGVSNSHEKRESEYKREKDLLLAQDPKKHIVYFSSLSIFYSDSRYAKHKKEMEALIKKTFKKYTILRIGNITWGVNPHTLINFFKSEAAKGKKLKIQDTYRYLVGKKELLHWISMIPDFSCEMNITGRRLTVKQIVKIYVKPKKKTVK